MIENYESFLHHWIDKKQSVKAACKASSLPRSCINTASFLVHAGVFKVKHPHWAPMLRIIENASQDEKKEEIEKGILFLKLWLDTDMTYNEAIVASGASTPLCDFMESLVDKGVFHKCYPDWEQTHFLLKQIEKDNPVIVPGDSSYDFTKSMKFK